uniref:Helitron helicase-like domain-containing protein n=1 Tax=Tanacetum cinerariifolium TaxID=118510 RepID=A0A6L2M6I8_TANCI|nr:helitron helicase-like domain-containing protein [Tanacetum cinerariifolium]
MVHGLGTESNVRSARSLGKETVLDFEHSAIRLTSPERDLQTALMESESLHGDIYGSLFQQSRSVERRGQSSFVGHNVANTKSATCVMLKPCLQPLSVLLSMLPVLIVASVGVNPSVFCHRQHDLNVLPIEIFFAWFNHRVISYLIMLSLLVRGNESSSYKDLGNCNKCCVHWGAVFWYEESLKGVDYNGKVKYHLCCGGGKIYIKPSLYPPDYIQQLLCNRHFMENIRAYNQTFAMILFGAKIDDSINKGKGP